MLGIRDQNVNQSYTHVMRRNEWGKITANGLVDRRLSPSLSIVLDAQFSFFSIRISFYCLLLSSIITHLAEHSKKLKETLRVVEKIKESSSLLLSLTIIVRGWRTIDSIIVLFSRSLGFFFRQVVMLLFTITPIPIRKTLHTYPNFTLQFFNCPVMNDSSMFISSVVLVFSMFDVCTRHIRRRREDDFFPPISTAEPNQIETFFQARWMETMMLDEIFKGSNNSLSDVDATLYVIPFALLYSWFYVPCCLLRSFSFTFTTHLYIVFSSSPARLQ